MASPSGKQRKPSPLTPEERDMFMAAVGDATPLSDAERQRARRSPPKTPRLSPSGRATRDDTVLPTEVTLTVDSSGERFSARGPGVSHEQAALVRSGKIHIEDTIDLHRLTREDGIARLRAFLLRARQAGRRCVLVIHGRGLHGLGHAPMREAVHIELLGPLSGLVRVATSAIQRDGGDGATYVVLRSAS
jgi:DNA-nicking Smr family endonuclease